MREFVNADPKTLEQEIIEAYEAEYGEILYPGHEQRIQLQYMLPIFAALRSKINDVGNSNLLKYSRGDIMKDLGETYHRTELIGPQKAVATGEITLSATRVEDSVFQSGLMITGDSVHYFLTTEEVTIPAGQLSTPVTLEAENAGPEYNDFEAGQINKSTKPLPYLATIQNVDKSSGGSEEESPEDYIERCRLAPETFSNAGHEESYIYFAKSADITIADVKVYSSAPATVNVVVLQKDGQIPTQAILDRVEEKLSAKDVRPLTDQVVVEAATVVNYDIDLTYYIDRADEASVSDIRSAVEDPDGAVDQFVEEQYAELENNINPDYLRKLLFLKGVAKVEMRSPTEAAITEKQVAIAQSINIVYGGVID